MPPLDAGIAQLVERNLAKVEVASSNLVSRSKHEKRAPTGALFGCHVQAKRLGLIPRPTIDRSIGGLADSPAGQ
jgi:hypothetical protein